MLFANRLHHKPETLNLKLTSFTRFLQLVSVDKTSCSQVSPCSYPHPWKDWAANRSSVGVHTDENSVDHGQDAVSAKAKKAKHENPPKAVKEDIKASSPQPRDS